MVSPLVLRPTGGPLGQNWSGQQIAIGNNRCMNLHDLKTGRAIYQRHAVVADHGQAVIHSQDNIAIAHAVGNSATWGDPNARYLAINAVPETIYPPTSLGVTRARGGLILEDDISLFETGTTTPDVLMIDASGETRIVENLGGGNWIPSIADGSIYRITKDQAPVTWKRTDWASAAIATSTINMSGLVVAAPPAPRFFVFSEKSLIERDWIHDGDQIYFFRSGTNPGVYCFPGADGDYTGDDVIWTELENPIGTSRRMAHYGDVLFVAVVNSGAITIHAYDKEDGEELWSATPSGSALTSFTAIEDRILVRTANQIHVLDSSTGDPLWSRALDYIHGPTGFLDAGWAMLDSEGHVASALSNKGHMAVLSPDGDVLWRNDARADDYRLSGAHSPPLTMALGHNLVAMALPRDSVVSHRPINWHADNVDTANSSPAADAYMVPGSTYDFTSQFLRCQTGSHVFAGFDVNTITTDDTVEVCALVLSWLPYGSGPASPFVVTPGVARYTTFPTNETAYNALTWVDGTPVTVPATRELLWVDMASIVQSLLSGGNLVRFLMRIVCGTVPTTIDVTSSRTSFFGNARRPIRHMRTTRPYGS